MTHWRLLACALLMVPGVSIANANSPVSMIQGAPTRIVIPAIDVDSGIEEVGLRERDGELEWATSSYAVGWHLGTAVPGETGNTVFSGHNNSRGGRVFKDLYRLKVGDRVSVYAGNRVFDYEVVERHILRELLAGDALRTRNAAWAGPFPDERLTLITCYPTWSNTHRLVVVARPIPGSAAQSASLSGATSGAESLSLPGIPLSWPDVFSGMPSATLVR